MNHKGSYQIKEVVNEYIKMKIDEKRINPNVESQKFSWPKVVVTTYSDDDEEDLKPLSNRINRACKPYMPFIDIINIFEKKLFHSHYSIFKLLVESFKKIMIILYVMAKVAKKINELKLSRGMLEPLVEPSQNLSHINLNELLVEGINNSNTSSHAPQHLEIYKIRIKYSLSTISRHDD